MGAQGYDYAGRAIIITESCCNCGVVFGLHEPTYNQRREDGKNFFCPNGHSQHYSETEASRLKKELEKERQRRTWAEQERDNQRAKTIKAQKRTSAFKGEVTKIKKRVHNGVCPCCNRSFQNLKRHMATKHPEKVKAVNR